MKPPRDFWPLVDPPPAPTVEELLALHEKEHRRRACRQREREWQERREDTRRDVTGALVGREKDGRPPSYLADESAFGPFARSELRASPKSGRVLQAGSDTWSPAWYAEPGSALERAMALLANGASRTKLLPDRILAYRVGWFPEFGLVFAEGHPSDGRLACADDLPSALENLETRLRDIGVAVGPRCRAGVRRIDSAVDLQTDSAAEGLAILAGVAALAVARGKLVAYRSGRATEAVLMKSVAGKTMARVYDKGVEAGTAPRGRLIRPEDQRRYIKGTRRDVSELTAAYVREQYQRRFMPLYQSAKESRWPDHWYWRRVFGRRSRRGSSNPRGPALSAATC